MYVTSSLSLSVHLIQSQVIAQQVLGCFEDEDCCPVRYLMQLFAKLDYFQSVFITKCLFEQSLFFGSSDQLKNVRSSFKWSLTDGKWRSCFSKKIYVHFPQVIPISNTKIWRKVKLFRLKTIIILKKEKNDVYHSELFVFPLSDHLDPVWNASQWWPLSCSCHSNKHFPDISRKKCILAKSKDNIMEIKKDEQTKKSFKSKSFQPTENCILSL